MSKDLHPQNILAKRTLDLLLIVFLAPLLLPLMAVIAIMIWIDSPGPVLYTHKRRGRHGRQFNIWKFRTMLHEADHVLHEHLRNDAELHHEWHVRRKLKQDPRVTRLGCLLRVASLDELPQIWNVLKGDMSVIGPRPIIDDEIKLYGESYSFYKQVLPGITGLWQVSGRNNTTYDKRVQLDVYYAENWSLRLDFFILLKTLKVLFSCEGAY